MTSIYLDHNATTPLAESVKQAMLEAMTLTGNPSSVHKAGREAKRTVEEARTRVAALVGARARDVVFTSGGTEANNLALKGAPAASYLISPIEHEATMAVAKELAGQGKEVSYLKLQDNGQIDLEDLKNQLSHLPKPTLISVMLVNNEIGLIQDLNPIIHIAREFEAFVHSDCVQAAGKIPVNIAELDLDYASFSAHKINGPKGIGALVIKPTSPMAAQIKGGGQELGRRSGTENLIGIAGFGAAALTAMEQLFETDRIKALRDHLEAGLRQHTNDILIIADKLHRTANVSCIAMEGTNGETQVMHMDLMGIAISSGSACSSGKVKTSHVLSALGYNEAISNSSIRVSLGGHTTKEEVDAFIKAWCTLYDRKKGN
ncbi:cysteine desulfurase family protein [Temperatibacter marinus]|uniref:Cysteine desulfurase n=1 Tax=Temperatibacter marinus TaxID=1456591 RepID=A0AA52EBC2_9PROT|nr:cysteine desulfurase family protein [Temperatibacter marinus]WND02207.1 cysteine desulfurase family protein [Temperatibacter marinus]